MIFIEAQGPRWTSIETILDILCCINFDAVKPIKKRNVKERLQVMVTLKDKPVMFVNFINGQDRADFVRRVKSEFEDVLSKSSDSDIAEDEERLQLPEYFKHPIGGDRDER